MICQNDFLKDLQPTRASLPDLEVKLKVLQGLGLPEETVHLGGVREQKSHGWKHHQSRTREQCLIDFVSNIKPVDSGCWHWIGGKDTYGYGHMFFLGKSVYAHRLALMISTGQTEMQGNVCHRCDNPQCVNPEHLYLGTQKQNLADMHQRGRAKPPKGVAVWSHKLTESQVLEVRLLHAGGSSLRSLSRKFHVSAFCIWSIVKRRTWKHIE